MTAVATTPQLTKAEAEQIIDEIESGLISTDRAFRKLFDSQGWLAAGYATFNDLFRDRLSGCKLADALQPDVVYALYNDGLDTEGVRAAMVGTGIHETKIKAIKELRDLGVPSGAVSARDVRQVERKIRAAGHIVHEHQRANPGPKRRVIITVTAEEYSSWLAFCKQHDVHLSDEVSQIVREHFAFVQKLCGDLGAVS